MQNFPGQIALERGNREAEAARMSEAREGWIDSAGWLDASIRISTGRWPISVGYSRKDRALLHLAENQLEAAEAEAQKAEEIFRSAEFDEGIAHINRTWGMIRRRQERIDESKQKLRAALNHFATSREQVEEARTQLEFARAFRAAGDQRPLVTREYLSAPRPGRILSPCPSRAGHQRRAQERECRDPLCTGLSPRARAWHARRH